MHVAIGLLTYVPGGSGGSEAYVRGLLPALAEAGVDVTALVNADGAHDFPGVRTVIGGAGGGGRAAKLGRLAGAILRPNPLRRKLEAPDVIHYPLTVMLPPPDRPCVTTLHDVQHRDLPELFTWLLRRYRALAYDRAARRADVVVVPSEFVRERVLATLGLDASRVRTIHHGIDHARFQPGPEAREPFLLYPARSWPHKNHQRLFEAFALLRRQRPDLNLVLTGVGTERIPVPAGVVARGGVTADELASLYRRTACLVFPSRYEGFGLPPLEAMACGAPVAAAAAGSIPEVCGDAAVLFDPNDPQSIADGVGRALDAPAELTARGLVRAAEFTWDAAAAAHDDVYQAVAAGVA